MTISHELVGNVVLYLASSLAQVWASLMVFHVLLTRDRCQSTDQSFDQEDKNASLWIGSLLLGLRAPAGLRGRLAEFGLDPQLLAIADTDRDARLKIVETASRHRMIEREGLRHADWSAEQWQSSIDFIAGRIIRIRKDEEEPGSAFWVGFTGVVVNLSLLVAYALLGGLPNIAEGIVGLLVLFNSGLGFRFAREIRRSLTCLNL